MAIGDDPYDLISAYSGTGPYLPQQTQTARQKFAQQLMLEGASTAPVGHPLAALARVLQGGIGGALAGQGERESLRQLAAQREAVFNAYGQPGQGPQPATQAQPGNPPGTPYTQIGLETVPAGGLPPLNLANIRRSVEGTEIPLTRMAQMTAKVETGTDDLKQASLNISPDTGGSKSYGIFGFNSGFGQGAGRGSAASFAASAPSLGLTATPGTPEFDAQWKRAHTTMPDQLVAAQLDFYQKQILPTLSTGLTQAGVPPGIANDPRTQAYFADRAVQYGPGSTAQHGARINQAVQQSGGTTEGFLRAMSTSDRANLQGDFRTYLSTRPQDVGGLGNRVATRERLALGIEGGRAAPGQAPATSLTTTPPTTTPTVMSTSGQVIPLAQPYRPSRATLDMAMSPDPRIAALGRQKMTEERKALEADWQVSPIGETGLFTVVNKKDPNQHYTVDSGAADEILRRQGALAGTKAASEITGRRTAERGLLATPEETGKLRDDFRQLPSFKNVNTVNPVYNSMVVSAGKDNRSSDLDLIYGLAKVLDPTSVVRETEQGIIQDIQRFPERMQSTIMSFVTGQGRLSRDARNEIMQVAYTRAKAFEDEYVTDRSHFGGIAERRGVDPRDIMRDYNPIKPYEPPEVKTETKPPTTPNQPGGWFTAPSGRKVREVK